MISNTKMIPNNNFVRGFTLIELLVVVAIIGLLASVVLAALNSSRLKGGDAAIKSNLASIRSQADLFILLLVATGMIRQLAILLVLFLPLLLNVQILQILFLQTRPFGLRYNLPTTLVQGLHLPGVIHQVVLGQSLYNSKLAEPLPMQYRTHGV